MIVVCCKLGTVSLKIQFGYLIKKYICYSGDDETTSPLDQYLFRDLAHVVRSLNKKRIIWESFYRKCPVDTTSRYEAVVKANQDNIIRLLILFGNPLELNEVFLTKPT
jgi:hypothetical protein